MQGDKAERWRHLCEQAAIEQNPEKLMMLVTEITQLLDEKEQRLKLQACPPQEHDTAGARGQELSSRNT